MKLKTTASRTALKSLAIIIILCLCSCNIKGVRGNKWVENPWTDNEVHVAANLIGMPPGKIVLVHDPSYGYCAIIMSNYLIKTTMERTSTEYESYYQPVIKGNHFSGPDLVIKKDKLYSPISFGAWRLGFRLSSPEVECGPIKLQWTGKGIIYFYGFAKEARDYGIEFAPTNWTDISEVDLSDPRIKWYKYGSSRERHTVNIDELWTRKEMEKEK